jgi:hypothetical protein
MAFVDKYDHVKTLIMVLQILLALQYFLVINVWWGGHSNTAALNLK